MEKGGELYEKCADALERDTAATADESVRRVLAALGYDGETEPQARAHRAAMLHAAARFSRIFQLVSPDAPGLICFGAEVGLLDDVPAGSAGRGWSVSGVGTTTRSAFESCVGEGVELLSSGAPPNGPLMTARRAEIEQDMLPGTVAALDALILHGCRDPDEPVGCVEAVRLADAARIPLPAGLCVWSDPGERPAPHRSWTSIGCAAGSTIEGATLHAALELVERDAVALWWRGGTRGGLVALEDPAAAEATALLAALRKGRGHRRSWLLDITTDLGIPCVAAISIDADGFGLACGTAARITLWEAARSAILEMFQIELAYRVVLTKLKERGESGLNDLDRVHLRRCREIDAHSCVLLQPTGPSRPKLALQELDTSAILYRIVTELAAHGIEVFARDLTQNSLGIPAAQVIGPVLEKEPSVFVGSRLRRAIEKTGGGQLYNNGVSLM